MADIRNLLSCFPAGYKDGDIIKQMLPPEDYKPKTEPKKAAVVDKTDPIKYDDVEYKDFFEGDAQDKMFKALKEGNETYVRQELMLKPGQDGLYLNLNVLPGGPGYGGPPVKDRRKEKIGDEGCKLIAKCLPQQGIRSLILQLGRNDISPIGAKALADGIPPDMEDLKILIQGNQIRNKGIIAIAQKIASMRNLKSLYLTIGANIITDQGNDFLAESLPPTLEKFHLMMRHNPMRQEGLPAWQRMWVAGKHLPLITNVFDAEQFWLLY